MEILTRLLRDISTVERVRASKVGRLGVKRFFRQKKDKGEVCWRKGCAKTLVVKIKCDVSQSGMG